MTARKPKPAKRTTRKRKTAKRASAKPARNVSESGLRIEYVPLASLEPAQRNPKAHSPELASSVDRWGFADAPILDGRTGRLVAGHGRREALLQRHAEGKAPPEHVRVAEDGSWLVPVQVGWSSKDDHEAEAFLLAHNKLTEAGGWDEEELAKAIRDLKTADVDLSGIGFDAKELRALAASLNVPPGGEPGPTEPPAKPKSKAGELYELGPHRLLCGDCTVPENVERLLAGAKPNLMVTDPPYGVEYDAAWRQGAGINDGGRLGQVLNDDRVDWREAWSLFPGAVAYVWHASWFIGEVQQSLKACDFEPRSQVIWAKPRFAISRGHYHWQHEPCWYAVRKGKAAAWAGDRSQTTLWSIALDKNVEGGHSTQKPLECMERPIRNHEGDVYDPFLGSGTTLIAAARQSRTCYGMELSPAYCDVIRKRWTAYADQHGLDAGPGALR